MQNAFGLLPLHMACLIKSRDRSGEIVRVLLEAFPGGVSLETAAGRLALHYAAEYASLEAIKLLIDAHPAGLENACVEDRGNTPLLMAVVSGNIENVKYICDNYPETTRFCNYNGKTALHLVAETDNYEIMEIIYKHNPDAIRQLDSEGRLPLHHFIQDHEELIVEGSKSMNCLRFLLKHYPDSTGVKDIYDDTPITLCNPEDLIVKRLLLNCRPDVDEEEAKRLNYACRRDAIFLAFAAINADGIPNIYCQLRAADLNVLKHVISYI